MPVQRATKRKFSKLYLEFMTLLEEYKPELADRIPPIMILDANAIMNKLFNTEFHVFSPTKEVLTTWINIMKERLERDEN